MAGAPRDARRPLVVFANGLGDHLMALPALRALAHGFEGRMTLLCPPRSRKRFFADLPLAQVVEARFRPGCRYPGARLDRLLPDWDLLVWLNPWTSEWARDLCRRTPAGASVGLLPECDVSLPLDYGKHSYDLAFDLARAVFPRARLEDFAQPPVLPGPALDAADRLRRAVPGDHRLLAVHADTLEEKRWPVERWRAVLNRFLARRPEWLALVVGLEDPGLEGGPHAGRIVSLCGRDLAFSMAVVARCDLFLGVDSCFLHAADAFRVPGVGLFGPTSADEFGFRMGGVHRHLQGDGRTDAIDVDRVLRALDQVRLESAGRPRPEPRPAPGQGHVYWTVDGGLRQQWRVPDLWRSAEGLPVRPLPVASFDLHRLQWFEPTDVPTVRQVAQHCKQILDADLGYPIILRSDGRIMDGMHRLARAWLEGREHIDTVRFQVDPRPDLVRVVD